MFTYTDVHGTYMYMYIYIYIYIRLVIFGITYTILLLLLGRDLWIATGLLLDSYWITGAGWDRQSLVSGCWWQPQLRHQGQAHVVNGAS